MTTTAQTRIARQRASILQLITLDTAKAWEASTEKYLFVIDLLDEADVPNSHWRWAERRLADHLEAARVAGI
jgi:hypothetical protein